MTFQILDIPIGFILMYSNKIIIKIYKTALYIAVEKENIEIIELLLKNDKIIDIDNILITFYHLIENFIFQCHFKS